LRLSAAPASGWNKYYTDTSGNAIVNTINASGNAISGWANAAFGGLAGGYNYWKIHDGTVLDSILTTEVVTISGVSGVDIEYTAGDNGLRISTGSLSGWANSTFTPQSAGSGLIKTSVGGDQSLHMDIEGSGQLRQLSFRPDGDGADQIRIGNNAGYNATLGSVIFDASGVGSGTTTIGYYAGYNAVESDSCDIIGYKAGQNASGCNETIMLGGHAGFYAEGCDYTNMVGRRAGREASGCDNANMMGTDAGYQASDCVYINMIGHDAGKETIGCNYTNMIGYQAGYRTSGCDHTNMIGSYAGYYASGCDYTNTMGYHAGCQASGCEYTNMMGYKAGCESSGCEYTNMIGYNAGYQATGCDHTNMMGHQVGFHASGCSLTNIIGAYAGYEASGCDGTNMIGYHAGYRATSFDNTNIIGHGAGYEASGCDYTEMMGWKAGYKSSGCDNTVMIGRTAGFQSIDHDRGIFMGYGAGYAAGASGATGTAGDDNIFIGHYAGKYRVASDCLIINPYRNDNDDGIGNDPPWSDGDEDGIVSIAALIHGQSNGPAGTTKHIRLGADPDSTSDLSSICLSVKSASVNDTVLRLVPFSSSQSAPQLEAIKKNDASIANPIVNDDGFLRIPVATYTTGGELYTASPASAATKIDKGDGVIAVYNIGSIRYMVVCVGTTWYRTSSLAAL
jgi:hypothetical protein